MYFMCMAVSFPDCHVTIIYLYVCFIILHRLLLYLFQTSIINSADNLDGHYPQCTAISDGDDPLSHCLYNQQQTILGLGLCSVH